MRRYRARSLTAFLLVHCAAFLSGGGGCTESGGATSPQAANVASVLVSTPNGTNLDVGATLQLSVTLRSASGVELTGRRVSWTSSNLVAATVDTLGLVSGIAPGTTTVTASSDGRSGGVALVVDSPPVATVLVSVPSGTLQPRAQVRASVTLRTASGDTLDGRAVGWRTSDTTVARVDNDGTVVAIGAGTADLVAISEGKEGRTSITVAPGLLRYRGLYVEFERRGFPNGYYPGDAIGEFGLQDQFIPSLGLVREEIARQMDIMLGFGVNNIVTELRTADSILVPRVFPTCNVSPSTGLLYPETPTANLDNLVAFFDLAQSKGLTITLRLLNTHMDQSERAPSQRWLGNILGRVGQHPALGLVTFEGDVFHRDTDGDGQIDGCGAIWEPPLNTGPDMPVARYVEWAMNYAHSLGIAWRKLSAQAVIGAYVVDLELGSGPEYQDRRHWHPLSVMRTVFDRLGVPDEERTYAVSLYEIRKCALASGYPCTDATPEAWANETLLRAWSRIGWYSRSNLMAAEYGANTAIDPSWNTPEAIESLARLMRKFGLEGGNLWHWVNSASADDASPGYSMPIKVRGTTYAYTAAAEALRMAYQSP